MNDWMIYDKNMDICYNILKNAIASKYVEAKDKHAEIEAEKRQLLQDELNLNEDISIEEKRLEDVIAKLNLMIADAKDIKANIERLKLEREQIHKTWIQKFANRPTEEYVQQELDFGPLEKPKMSLHQIFDRYFAGLTDEYYKFLMVVKGDSVDEVFCSDIWNFDDIINRVIDIDNDREVIDILNRAHRR